MGAHIQMICRSLLTLSSVGNLYKRFRCTKLYGSGTLSNIPMTNTLHGTIEPNRFTLSLKVCPFGAKANANAKKIKEQSEEIKSTNGKHQRKFSLSRSISLGVGRPLRPIHTDRKRKWKRKFSLLFKIFL